MEQFKDRLKVAICASVFVAATLLLTVPIIIYHYNAGEFTLQFVEFLVFSGIMFVTAVVGTSAVLPLFRGSAFRILACLLFAFGVLCLIQGNLLAWNYGPLTGREIFWERYWTNGLIDSPIWIVGLGLALCYSRRLVAQIASVSVILVVLQVVHVALLIPRTAKEEQSASVKQVVIDNSRKFTFSNSTNAILIVLDESQSDVFQALVAQDDLGSDWLRGFTYFPDAVGSSTFTEIAVPGLLTSKAYDNSVPRRRYLKESFLHSSVLSRLVSAGYTVDAFPWVGWANESMLFDTRIATNYKLRESDGGRNLKLSEKQAKESLNLVDLALLRCAPHFLKKHIYNDHRWFLVGIVSRMVPENIKIAVAQDNKFDVNRFVDSATTAIQVEGEQPTFKYYHLKGAHEPLTVGQDSQYTEEVFPLTRDNYMAQYRAALIWLDKFFVLLRENGVYDDALIVVVGDHGNGRIPELYIHHPDDGNIETDPMYASPEFQSDKARANPLIMFKRPGANGPFEVSAAPVSLFDVPKTLLSQIGVPVVGLRGESMFDILPTAPRKRHFYAFDFAATAREYLPPIRQYEVTGNVRRNGSWSKTGVLESPK